MNQRLLWILLLCAGGLLSAAAVFLFLCRKRAHRKTKTGQDPRPEDAPPRGADPAVPDAAVPEDPALTALFRENPKVYIGICRGIWKTAQGNNPAWRSCLRTWQQRTLKQYPELAESETAGIGLLPDSDEKAAAFARGLLVSIREAGIVLLQEVPSSEPEAYFVMRDGSDPVAGNPYRVESPAFLWNGDLLEAGTLVPAGEAAETE